MNLSGVIMQLISLFLMMFVGYVVARSGIMTPDFRARLSTFTLSCVAPFAILSSVLESNTPPATMLSARSKTCFGLIIVFLWNMILPFQPKPHNVCASFSPATLWSSERNPKRQKAVLLMWI